MDKPRFSTFDESNKAIEAEVRIARSSILKPQRPRTPFQETTFGYLNEDSDLINRRRRVSFAGVNIVKEFCSKTESQHIGHIQAYEETFSVSSDSSHFSNSVSSTVPVAVIPINVPENLDDTLLEKSMDLTLDSVCDNFIQHCEQSGKIKDSHPCFDILKHNQLFMESNEENNNPNILFMGQNSHFPVSAKKYESDSDKGETCNKKVSDISDINMSMTNVLYRPEEFTAPLNKDEVNRSNFGELSNTDMEFTEAIQVQIGNRFPVADESMNASGMEFTEILPSKQIQFLPQTLDVIPVCSKEESCSVVNGSPKYQEGNLIVKQPVNDNKMEHLFKNKSLLQDQLQTSMEFTNIHNFRPFINIHPNAGYANVPCTIQNQVIDMELTEQVPFQKLNIQQKQKNNLTQTHEESEMQFTDIITKTALNKSIGTESTEAAPCKFQKLTNLNEKAQSNQKSTVDVKETNPLLMEMSIVVEIPGKQYEIPQKKSLALNLLEESQSDYCTHKGFSPFEKIQSLGNLEAPCNTEQKFGNKFETLPNIKSLVTTKQNSLMTLPQNGLSIKSQNLKELSADFFSCDPVKLPIKKGLHNKFDVYVDSPKASENNCLSETPEQASTAHTQNKREKSVGELLSRRSLALPDNLDDSIDLIEGFSHKKTCIRSPATCERVTSSFQLTLNKSLELTCERSLEFMEGVASSENVNNLNEEEGELSCNNNQYEMSDDNPLKGILDESVQPYYLQTKSQRSKPFDLYPKLSEVIEENCCEKQKYKENNDKGYQSYPPTKEVLDENLCSVKSKGSLYTELQSPNELKNEKEIKSKEVVRISNYGVDSHSNGIQDKKEIPKPIELTSNKHSRRFTCYYPENETEDVQDEVNISNEYANKLLNESILSELSAVKNKSTSGLNSMNISQNASSESGEQEENQIQSLKIVNNDTLLKGILDDSEPKSLDFSTSMHFNNVEGSFKYIPLNEPLACKNQTSNRLSETVPYKIKNPIGELLEKRRSEMSRLLPSTSMTDCLEKPVENSYQSPDKVITCHPLQEVLQSTVIESMENLQQSSIKKQSDVQEKNMTVEGEINQACESLHKTYLSDVTMSLTSRMNYSKSGHTKINLLEKFNNSDGQKIIPPEIDTPDPDKLDNFISGLRPGSAGHNTEVLIENRIPETCDIIPIVKAIDNLQNVNKFVPFSPLTECKDFEFVEKQPFIDEKPQEMAEIEDFQMTCEIFNNKETYSAFTQIVDSQTKLFPLTDHKKSHSNITHTLFMPRQKLCTSTPYEKLSYLSGSMLSTPCDSLASTQLIGVSKTLDQPYPIRIKNRDFMSNLGFKRITLSVWKYKICQKFYLVIETALQEILDFTQIKKIYFLRKPHTFDDQILDFIEINFKVFFPDIQLINQCKDVNQIKLIIIQINEFSKKLTPIVESLNYLSKRFPFTLNNWRLSFTVINLDARLKFDVIIDLSEWKKGIGKRNVSVCQGIGKISAMRVKFLFNSDPFEKDIFFKYIMELKKHCGLLCTDIS